MTIDPGALARLRVRIEEILGVSDTAALLDPLAHVEWAKLVTTDDLDLLRADVARLAESQAATDRRLAELQAATDRRLGDLDRRLGESQISTARQIADMQSKVRRDLLLVTGAQFFALIGAVAAVLGLA